MLQAQAQTTLGPPFSLRWQTLLAIVQTLNDSYTQNHASVAGGAMFSSDIKTTHVLCLPDGAAPASEHQAGCSSPAWGGNTAVYEYDLAYPPHQLLVTTQDLLNYVSNGLDTLPMVVQAQDQAGTAVIMGMYVCIIVTIAVIMITLNLSTLINSAPNDFCMHVIGQETFCSC